MEAMEIRALEEMAANAHVALNMMQYDGWLLRFSAGHTNRANSVSVLYPSTINTDEKIGYCERQYRAQGLPCVFKLTDADGELGALLEKRGYGIVTPTDVMILDLPEMEMPDGEITFTDRPAEEWLRAYFDFEGLTDPARQDIFRRMLEKVLVRTRYAALKRDGRIIACASSAAERGYALLQNIVVDPEYRGRGFGRTICRALLAEAAGTGIGHAYLQVVQSNTPAMRLYESLGFRKVYTYRYLKQGT